MYSSDQVEFDFQAMLMYGWLADRDLYITAVNESLQWWMSHFTPKLLDQIRRGDRPTVREFISALLDTEAEDCTGELVGRHLAMLTELIERINEGQRAKPPEVEFFHENGYTIRRVVRPVFDEDRLLVAIRLVKPGGSQMISRDYRDRVDLVCVCVVCRDSRETPWRVKSFQGQLQEAWLRVKPVITMGTQVGATALMGRNLSHNIGSHVLYWLSQDEGEESRRRFLRYIQVRMELIAGFATCMPLSPTTFNLWRLIDDFGSNLPLLERICRSEGIESVHIDFLGNTEVQVAIPGGDIGVHALYSILENCIRDSGKHALVDNSGGDLKISVIVTDCDDLIQVVICDDRHNYKEAAPEIEEIIEGLRVADEAGRLIPGGWGVKERFICASFLRGIRLEQIDYPELGKLDNLSLGCIVPGDGPRILAISNIEGNLGWVFSLLKPEQDMLLVRDSSGYDDRYTSRPGLTIQDGNWLEQKIDEPSAVRHRFVVFDSSPPAYLQWLAAQRVKMPERMFINPSAGDSFYSWLAPLAKEDMQDLSPPLLQRRWVEHLLRQKEMLMPIVVLADALKLERRLTHEPLVYMVPQQFEAWIKARSEEKDWQATPLVILRRHTAAPPMLWQSQGKGNTDVPNSRLLHFECHQDGGTLRQLVGAEFITENDEMLALLGYRLIEAALTRILIIDERIDASMSKSRLKGFARKKLLQWKGIDVRGSEYSVVNPPGPEILFDWLAEGRYDIVLLHQGIADKIRKLPTGLAIDQLCVELQGRVRQVIIHSGRMDMAQLPPKVKFLPFSNLMSWLDRDESKLHIVEELSSLRRV